MVVHRRRPVGLDKGRRTFQLPSCFNPRQNLRVRSGTIVAKVFFATDESSLRSDDIKALDKLVRHYKQRLEENCQVSLSFVGRTDHTYRDAYNQQLSERRARAVHGYVRTRLGDRQGLYLSLSGTGESFAKQYTAQDRRVDVYELVKPPSKKRAIAKKTKRVPVRWVRRMKTIAPGGMGMNPSYLQKTYLIIIEEYKNVDKSHVVVRTDTKQLAFETGSSWGGTAPTTTIERHRMWYGVKSEAQRQIEVIETGLKIIKWIDSPGGDAEMTHRIYKSWDEYPRGNNLLNKFRPR